MPDLNSLTTFLERFTTNGAIPSTIVVGLLLMVFAKTISRGSGRTLGLTIWTLWSLAIVAGFTLRLGDANGTADSIWIFNAELWKDAFVMGTNWYLNAALFIPAGLTLSLFFRSPLKGVGILVIASVLIETVQQITRVGIPDPSDFIANSAGAVIGAIVATVFLAIRKIIRR